MDLRAAAAQRAQQHSQDDDDGIWFPPSSSAAPQREPFSLALPASTTSTPHPQPAKASDILKSSRQRWKQHGTGVTQVVEDVRHTCSIIVRVTEVVQCKDASGKAYDAYCLAVQQPQQAPVMHYRRFSDFARLQQFLAQHGIRVEATFPPKSTLSKKWAPERHRQLLQYRLQQFDVWLVHVVALLHTLPPVVHAEVTQFLLHEPPLPCERDNEVLEAKGWNKNPLSFTLGSALRQGVRTIQSMTSPDNRESNIPVDLLHHARGILLLTVIKAGLVVSGRVGSGLVVARMPNGSWSAPVAVGTVGVGWGAVIGGDISEYLVIFTTTQAVQDILGQKSSVQLGGELDVAVGPVGRGAKGHVQTGDWTLHTAYSYAHSQGLFVGLSLEGSVLSVRNDVNANFYGRPVAAAEIVQSPQPKAAEPLYRALDEAIRQEIPEGSFRPSQFLTP